MDAIFILFGGLLILGSVYLSLMLQREYAQNATRMAYNSRMIDCHDWMDILTGDQPDTMKESTCLLPNLSGRQDREEQTIENLLIQLQMNLANPIPEKD